MDNVCHTLVGAAAGEAGLKTRTRWGNPILMVAANLPDLDVLSFAASVPAVALRRGWTHGVLAQVLLPLLMTAGVMLLDRWRPPAGGGRRARALPTLALCYVGVLSHVALDWLNSYGVRLLMPFSSRWFYGDAVFIVDPWLWLAFGGGVFLARRYSRPARAAVALVAATIYIGGMVWSARAAREAVRHEWTARIGRQASALMVGPSFATPVVRSVIIDMGDHYRTGRYSLATGELTVREAIVPRNEHLPASMRARADPAFRAVLVWARFPFYELTAVPGGTRVTLADMRFGSRVGAVSTVVPPDSGESR